MFLILFKLLTQSEENEAIENESDFGSQRSSDSAPLSSLISSIASKKNIIARALILGFYKSSFQDENSMLMKVCRSFFLIFMPHAFQSDKKETKLDIIDTGNFTFKFVFFMFSISFL
jgi:hypothetical protein